MLGQRSAGKITSIVMVTGGSGYSSPPTITLIGGSGAGASAVAQMAGTVVDSISIVNGGSGYAGNPTVFITGGSGSGASAQAYAYTGPLQPASFVRSRYNDLYMFDGMGRGLRWNGVTTTMQPIGVRRPNAGPTVVVNGSAMQGEVESVTIISPGGGYSSPPAVSFSGGNATTEAKATAEVAGGRVTNISVLEPGSGYATAPAVLLTGGIAQQATFGASVSGSVVDLTITSGGTGYTSPPTVVFPAGITNCYAVVTVTGGTVSSVDANGNLVSTVVPGIVDSVTLLSGGTGATTAVNVTLTGGSGSGASLRATMRYTVTGVTVVSGGVAQYAPPPLTFRPDPSDTNAIAAVAAATVNTTGVVTGVTLYSGGAYTLPPTCAIEDQKAIATATIVNRVEGTYKCAMRYIDNTPASARGPIPSSISELKEVAVIGGAPGLLWQLPSPGSLDDRVAAMELWRTSADQSVLLYRVATLARGANGFASTFADNLSDSQLTDPERAGYGLMPVTLPSGQLNARRFGVPPGNYAVACMFQDRCWLAVDTTARSPNSLLFSEVDEPESIPEENEIVLQESAGDSDAIVALIPLGSSLIVAQSRHLYKLQYVAQPVIDASIMLVGYRGVLHQRCWDIIGGLAFIVDTLGMYSFDGNQEEPISIPIDNLWRDGTIDFSKSAKFHVAADHQTKVVRFFYCGPSDTEPVNALCYCMMTKAWWLEQYPGGMTASTVTQLENRQQTVYATAGGSFVRHAGSSDLGTAIPWAFRTGNMQVSNDNGDRSLTLVYTPTDGDTDNRVNLHFNGSPTPRPNAITTSRSPGNVALQGDGVSVNFKKSVSPLGDSPGVSRLSFSGRADERSVGADKHMAVAMSGSQTANSPVIHAVQIAGVT